MSVQYIQSLARRLFEMARKYAEGKIEEAISSLERRAKSKPIVAEAPKAEASTAETTPAPVKVAKVKKAKKGWKTYSGHYAVTWFFFWPVILFVRFCEAVIRALVGFVLWVFKRMGWLVAGVVALFVAMLVIAVALGAMALVTWNLPLVGFTALVIFFFAPIIAGGLWLGLQFVKFIAWIFSDKKAAKAKASAKAKANATWWFWASLLGTIVFAATPLVFVFGTILVYTCLYVLNEWLNEHEEVAEPTAAE